jgi:hypothetical protein
MKGHRWRAGDDGWGRVEQGGSIAQPEQKAKALDGPRRSPAFAN